MNIGEVENAIITKLSDVFPEFEVCSFPANFEGYTFSAPIGCMLVKYDYTQFSGQETLWNVQQTGTVKFSIISGYRGMSGYGQIHPYQDKIRRTLRGFELFGRKIDLGKEEFLSEIDGDLYVGLEIGIKITEEDEYNGEIQL